MAEAATQYVVQFEEGFPRAEVEALGVELMAAGILAPGFIPPSAGLLRLEAIVYAKDEQGYDTVVLPDRNLVSRMARVARDGHAELRDKTTRSAVALMAYCQAMQVLLEPSIAFHELGFVLGNSIAREELAWFRAADRGAVLDWVLLAAGQKDRVTLGDPAAPCGRPAAHRCVRVRVRIRLSPLLRDATGPPSAKLDGAQHPRAQHGPLQRHHGHHGVQRRQDLG